MEKLANIWANKRFEEDGKIYYTFSEEALKVFTQKVVHSCCIGFGKTRVEPSLEKYLLMRLGIHGKQETGESN